METTTSGQIRQRDIGGVEGSAASRQDIYRKDGTRVRVSRLPNERRGVGSSSPATVERFVERVNRLYEQGASLRCIGAYVRRWMVWVVSGLERELGILVAYLAKMEADVISRCFR